MYIYRYELMCVFKLRRPVSAMLGKNIKYSTDHASLFVWELSVHKRKVPVSGVQRYPPPLIQARHVRSQKTAYEFFRQDSLSALTTNLSPGNDSRGRRVLQCEDESVLCDHLIRCSPVRYLVSKGGNLCSANSSAGLPWVGSSATRTLEYLDIPRIVKLSGATGLSTYD